MIGSALDINANHEHAANVAQFNARREELENPKWRDGPMHVITGGRAEGKTHLAMRWLLEAPEGIERCLIVPWADEAERLKHQHDMKRNDPRIVSLAQYQRLGARPDVEYGIDELGTILERLLGLKASPHLLTVCTAAPWQG